MQVNRLRAASEQDRGWLKTEEQEGRGRMSVQRENKIEKLLSAKSLPWRLILINLLYCQPSAFDRKLDLSCNTLAAQFCGWIALSSDVVALKRHNTKTLRDQEREERRKTSRDNIMVML